MNYMNMKGENEFTMMTMAEANERNKIVRQEAALFAPRAPRSGGPMAARKDPPVPRSVFPRPCRAAHRDALRPRRRRHPQARQTDRSEERRREILAKNEENKAKKNRGGRYNRTVGTSEDFYDEQRADREDAFALLRDKLDELLGAGDTPHARNVKPGDVFDLGRPKR